MKALTNEGLAGLIALIINIVGVVLGMVVPADWADAIPLILAVLDAIGALLLWYLSRQTKKELLRLRGR